MKWSSINLNVYAKERQNFISKDLTVVYELGRLGTELRNKLNKFIQTKPNVSGQLKLHITEQSREESH